MGLVFETQRTGSSVWKTRCRRRRTTGLNVFLLQVPETEISVHRCYDIAVSASELEITETGEQGRQSQWRSISDRGSAAFDRKLALEGQERHSLDWLQRELTTITTTGDSEAGHVSVESDNGRGRGTPRTPLIRPLMSCSALTTSALIQTHRRKIDLEWTGNASNGITVRGKLSKPEVSRSNSLNFRRSDGKDLTVSGAPKRSGTLAQAPHPPSQNLPPPSRLPPSARSVLDQISSRKAEDSKRGSGCLHGVGPSPFRSSHG